jgi:hypothetical protein
MNTNISKSIFILVCSVAVFSSCKKVIQLDLKESDRKIVIEGGISDASAINTIQLTKSLNFTESNVFPGVSGAEVKITDDLGNAETLKETSAGIYQTATLKGVQGRTYYLSVIAEGRTYTAQSTMPFKVNFDSLLFKKVLEFGKDSSNYVMPWFQDPAGIKNYYRFLRYVNGIKLNGCVSENDYPYDGLYHTFQLFDTGLKLHDNDSLMIEMQCVDRAVSLYFTSKQQTTDEQTGAPANPATNMTGGALGYFSAYTSQTKKIRIP